MSPLSTTDAQNIQGATMLDSAGTKIGKINDVYLDSDTQTPEWALVHTGLFSSRESFVPLAQAQLAGGDLTVPYTKDQVKGAPNAEPDGELSQDEEARLYSHYGLNYTESASDSGLPTTAAPAPATSRPATPPARGHDVDDAMTRSEERLTVGVQRRPSQTVRLKKRVITDNVTQTVPVNTERATVTSEPITDANRPKAMDGPEITEAVHEVTLTAERPVVAKETIPVERIRLAKDTVTEEQTVTEEVRKEQIELEDEPAPAPPRAAATSASRHSTGAEHIRADTTPAAVPSGPDQAPPPAHTVPVTRPERPLAHPPNQLGATHVLERRRDAARSDHRRVQHRRQGTAAAPRLADPPAAATRLGPDRPAAVGAAARPQ